MGPLNDYNKISEVYNLSNTKPDKLYSILPTILKISELKSDPKSILDLGCGNGFFTFALAEKYKDSKVIGIDNSRKQIAAAQEIQKDIKVKSLEFRLGDISTDTLPQSDIIIAPFVLGYFTDEQLSSVFKNIFEFLEKGGILIIVLDDPKGIDNSKFGARKTVENRVLSIELFDKDSHITTLKAINHTVDSVTQKLITAGFSNITEHTPVIRDEGYVAMSKDFWNGYTENSELVYLSCVK